MTDCLVLGVSLKLFFFNAYKKIKIKIFTLRYLSDNSITEWLSVCQFMQLSAATIVNAKIFVAKVDSFSTISRVKNVKIIA